METIPEGLHKLGGMVVPPDLRTKRWSRPRTTGPGERHRFDKNIPKQQNLGIAKPLAHPQPHREAPSRPGSQTQDSIRARMENPQRTRRQWADTHRPSQKPAQATREDTHISVSQSPFKTGK